MGLYTTVTTRDDAGNAMRWNFRRGRYDDGGVYDASARMDDGTYRHAFVVVTDGAVEEVVPVELPVVECGNPWRCDEVIERARALAVAHGVAFDEDGFGF